MRLEQIKSRPLDADEQIFKKKYLSSNHSLWEKPMTFAQYQDYAASGKVVLTPSSYFYRDRSRNNLGNTMEEADNSYHVELTLHTRYSYPVLHNHSYIELIYVAAGTVKNLLRETQFDMSEGDVCILSPNSFHALSCTNDESCILNIMIGKDFFDQNFFRTLSGGVIINFMKQVLYQRVSSPYILLPTRQDPWLHTLAQHLVTEMVQKKRGSDYSIRLLTGEFLIHLSREYETLAIVPNTDTGQPNDIIVALLSYLGVNQGRVTLEETAKFFGYSPAYLSRTIRQNVGKTFTALTAELQMKHAAELLKNTGMSIAEIAQECGCFDSSHLGKKFRSQYDMSPLEYREKNKK